MRGDRFFYADDAKMLPVTPDPETVKELKWIEEPGKSNKPPAEIPGVAIINEKRPVPVPGPWP